MCMFLVTNPRCQEAEKIGSRRLGIIRWPEKRPAFNNFPEWKCFRFSSTIPRIETWLRVLESFWKILKPLKLDAVKAVAGSDLQCFVLHMARRANRFCFNAAAALSNPMKLTCPQDS